jgi:glycosyltransferase involved in cell wall biosynthesis
LDAPEYIVPRHQKYLSRRVPQSVGKATHVIAVSENTKRRLVERYGTDPAKITVIEPALDHQAYQPASSEVVATAKQKYGITKPYLLYLGTMEPRKNIAGIIRAYTMLTAKEQASYQLVLAGGKGWLDTEINQLIDSLPAESVVRTGYVDDGDKPALYTGATLFLYPSHYEGWGMQLLESMACGTPAITARNSSLVEAGGEAAAYIDENTPEALGKLVQAILYDPERQEKMRKAGFKHAKEFTWKRSAKKLAVVLRSLKTN